MWCCAEFVPYDRLITRMGVPSGITGCSTTQSSAAMTWLTSVLPSVVASLTASSLASGATPSCTWAGAPARSADGFATPRPAMMPARYVPWP